MSTYVYDKLDPSRKQIRICTIHPGAFEDPVKCSLSTVSLDDNPEYETLSYAWGAPVFDHTLLVDGAILKVTKSLHNALRYLRPWRQLPGDADDGPLPINQTRKIDQALRYFRRRTKCPGAVDESSWEPEASGILWADAICINQADIEERSSQVGFMGDIYRCGSRLHVWIGTVEEIRNGLRQRHPFKRVFRRDRVTPKRLAEFKSFLISKDTTPPGPSLLVSASIENVDADVLGAMEILQLLAEDKHVQHLPFFKFTATNLDLEKNAFWYKSIAMLVGILTQPWWHRLWVVQEILLSTSSHAALLHISQHSIPLTSCYKFVPYFSKHLFGCCDEWLDIVVGNHSSTLKFWDSFNILRGLRGVADQYRRDGKIDIISAYRAVRSRGATDPHDYIYGLHALVKDFPSNMVVDYHMPVPNLYSLATRAVFDVNHSLDELKRAIGVESGNRHHLPSWCMDWSEGYKLIGLFDHARGLFNAAKEPYTQQLHPLADDRVLRIEAANKGSITCVSTRIKGKIVDPLEAVIKWISGTRQHHVDSDLTDTALRILTRGLYSESEFHRTSSRHVEVFRGWRQFIKDHRRRPTGTFSETELLTVDVETRRQRFFMTSGGRLGAGPTVTKEGDCLFLAKGSEWPLLLRPYHDTPIGNGKQEQPSTYQFVGQCYVDGIMDGEAVTADTEWRTICLS
ncbi:MAG: hypothetical protein Q9192_007081 [Flavoplaca navasiana]